MLELKIIEENILREKEKIAKYEIEIMNLSQESAKSRRRDLIDISMTNLGWLLIEHTNAQRGIRK